MGPGSVPGGIRAVHCHGPSELDAVHGAGALQCGPKAAGKGKARRKAGLTTSVPSGTPLDMTFPVRLAA